MKNRELEGIRVVFDIDDTICNNNNRQYDKAIPFIDVINKINDLHNRGAKIILYTSRGMKSCNGDIEKIIVKNKAVLEKWLKENNVHYDELQFGKPLGDMYIDDKAMNVREFNSNEFYQLKGKSGYNVVRIGNIVKKEMMEENYQKLMSWYKESEGLANNPKLISNLYSTIYIEYIDGVSCDRIILERILIEVLSQAIEQVETMKKVKYLEFKIEKLLNKLDTHKSEDEEWNKKVDECKKMIQQIDFIKHASLSHGDYTLNNMIYKDGKLYLLDSLFDKEASSYLLDLAKLKMSLDGYEEKFLGNRPLPQILKDYLIKYLEQQGILKEVNILEYMYAIRLYRYNDNKKLVKEFVDERRKEIW